MSLAKDEAVANARLETDEMAIGLSEAEEAMRALNEQNEQLRHAAHVYRSEFEGLMAQLEEAPAAREAEESWDGDGGGWAGASVAYPPERYLSRRGGGDSRFVGDGEGGAAATGWEYMGLQSPSVATYMVPRSPHHGGGRDG